MGARRDPFGDFSQSYLFEIFESEPSFAYRKMFGGLAIYLFDRMVSVLVEDPKGTSWAGKDYGFPIWNGMLIPTSHEHHESLADDFTGMSQHPVLRKWMYLPMASDNYESTARLYIKALKHQDPRLGVVPGQKRGKRKVTKIRLKP